MFDSDSLLLVMQSGSMGVMLTLCLVLVLSHYQKPDTTKIYERLRLLLIFAMLLLVVHYALQICFGIRAQGDDVGAMVNILFYSPVIYLLSYTQVRIGCGSGYQNRHILASIISMILISGCCLFGYLHFGSLHMKGALHVMGLLFFLTLAYFILYPASEIRRVRKKVDEESGEEPVQYNLYMRACTILLDLSAVLIPFSIFYTPALVFAGPVILASLVFYIISFVALGFDFRNVNNIIDEQKYFANTHVSDILPSVEDESATEGEVRMSVEAKKYVSLAIETWRCSQGYSQADLNSVTLATRLNIPKRQLVQYLREVEGKTFRVWLSDLRLGEAKRLIREHPEFSNESIAESCGLSRTHLQTKFKESTGMTTNEWRDAHLA